MLNEVRVARAWLIVIALSIGVAVAAAERFLFSSFTGRSLVFVSDVDPPKAILVAIPYLCLALAGTKRLLPWLVGLALTLPLWSYALYSGVSYQRNPDGSGANIGLGLLMLASPFFISPIVLGVHALQRRAAASH